MAIDINNPYVRNQVLTAPPEKLRLMLLDGCVRFMREGRDGLASKDYEAVYTGFSQAKDILLELISSMDRERAPELCAKITSLYTFVFKHLTEASFEKDTAKADECIRIMTYERETWAMFLERLAKERNEEEGASVEGGGDGGVAVPARAALGPAGGYGSHAAAGGDGGGVRFSA
jgi:flagellar protein FliS